ncbi:MAG: AAA family ATPase [Candidatus Omnitrophica bacterium]|nr:AAA family ATPase [Candidatus Omnitrophota bacterium]
MKKEIPLAVRMRPVTLDEFIGQEHILGKEQLLRRAIESKKIPSVILSGPPGCGKTTLGTIIARELSAAFVHLNAAFSSVADLRKVVREARRKEEERGEKTVLFIDEIHRFNKTQQEALIPDTENGTLVVVGATIYQPTFYLIPSLISRSIVAAFRPLGSAEVEQILKRALRDRERGVGKEPVNITNKAISFLAEVSSGDARAALTALEIGVASTPPGKDGKILFDLKTAQNCMQKNVRYDRQDANHYDTISAFIKSIRGSDPDSALYWLAKMIHGGEDPRFIARRLVILAAEDVGNAEPFALVLATNCFRAVEVIGYPEAKLILAQATVYLACAPKSNASYQAILAAIADIERSRTVEVPSHLKTHARTYRYPHRVRHEGIGGFVPQEYGAPRDYFFPSDAGYERKMKEFLARIGELEKREEG